jgi:cytoskeletal protein CcmA (bactofilin family)
MFNKKKQPNIKSLIAEGTCITGTISFSDGMRIDGEVIGGVSSNEQQGGTLLVISETAMVQGPVSADHIIINGWVRGTVYAQYALELQPKARIEGDVQYAALEMHQGALITGQLRPLFEGEEKPTLKLASNNY